MTPEHYGTRKETVIKNKTFSFWEGMHRMCSVNNENGPFIKFDKFDPVINDQHFWEKSSKFHPPSTLHPKQIMTNKFTNKFAKTDQCSCRLNIYQDGEIAAL